MKFIVILGVELNGVLLMHKVWNILKTKYKGLYITGHIGYVGNNI